MTVEEIRGNLKVGDILYYPRLKKVGTELAEVWEKARITGVYPYLVSIAGSEPEVSPRTLTYSEIIMSPKIISPLRERWENEELDWTKSRGKKGPGSETT